MSVNDILTISEPLVLTSERNLRILARHIARERAQPLSEVINEIEHLYVKTAKAQYGEEYEFWSHIQQNGQIKLAQVLKIVDRVECEQREVKFTDVIAFRPDAKIGTYICNALSPIHPAKIEEWLAAAETLVQKVQISARLDT